METAVHPAREGGISSEYTKFIARNTTGSGNILTLAQPTVFNNAHPAGTQVIVGAKYGWALYGRVKFCTLFDHDIFESTVQ